MRNKIRAAFIASTLLFTMLCSPTVTNASDFLGATIQAVRPDNYDIGGVFLRVVGTRTGAQPCPFPDGGAYSWYFISKNNPMMKELLSAALGAKLSEKPVTIVGKGTCTQGYEDVRYIEIN